MVGRSADARRAGAYPPDDVRVVALVYAAEPLLATNEFKRRLRPVRTAVEAGLQVVSVWVVTERMGHSLVDDR